MSTITELLERYDTWEAERTSYHEREEGEPVSSSQWENSDDEGTSLAGEFASALREPRVMWSLSIVGSEQPLTTTLHDTEEAAIESLEVTHGDLVDREADIISDLENVGYTIEIDKHEI